MNLSLMMVQNDQRQVHYPDTKAMMPANPAALPEPLFTEEEQLSLFDAAPFIRPAPLAAVGSQRWVQVTVEYAPDVLQEVLRPHMGIEAGTTISWRSPRAADGFREFRDRAALELLGIRSLPYRRLENFWPSGGPQWDALGKTSGGEYLFVEAKGHVGEIWTPGTQARCHSRRMIEESLREARHYYCPGSQANWSSVGYQYANRLAFHYLFRVLNRLPSHMVFLYFLGAGWIPRPLWRSESGSEQSGSRQSGGQPPCDKQPRPVQQCRLARRPHLGWTQGPRSEWEWEAAIGKLHARLALTDELRPDGVHQIFIPVPPLVARTGIPLFDAERLIHAGMDPAEVMARESLF